METIVYMLVSDILDKELILYFSMLLINMVKKKKKRKCILAVNNTWFWQIANESTIEI